jgi:hypothetical protein
MLKKNYPEFYRKNRNTGKKDHTQHLPFDYQETALEQLVQDVAEGKRRSAPLLHFSHIVQKDQA